MRLKKWLFIIILLLCLVVTGNTAAIAEETNTGTSIVVGDEDTKEKTILYISSYSLEQENVERQLEGIESELDDYAQLKYIFMDTKTYSRETADPIAYEVLSAKMRAGEHYDAVILGDDAALLFGMRYRDSLLKDIPIVFEGINDIENAEAAAVLDDVTGIVERLPFSEVIDFALSVYPNAKNVITITDGTVSGRGALRMLSNVQEQYKSLTFSNIETGSMTKNELINTIGSFGQEDIVLFLIMGNDGDGNLYTISSAGRFFLKYAGRPIFTVDELGTKYGLTGGCVVSYREMGAAAGRLVKRILNGENASEIPLQDASTHYSFNMDLVEHYGIPANLIPMDAERINDSDTLSDRAKSLIAFAVASLSILIYITVMIAVESRKRGKLLAVIKDKDKTLNTILSSIPSGVGMFNIHGDKVEHCYLNDGYYAMIERSPEKGSRSSAMRLDEVIHPDEAGEFRRLLKEAVEGKDRIRLDARIIKGDDLTNIDNCIWMNISGIVTERKNEEITLLCCFTDIDDEQKARHAIEESEATLQAAIEHSEMTYWEYYPDTHTAVEGARACKELGLEKFIANYPEVWFERGYVHPDSVAVLRELFHKIDNGAATVECEIQTKHLDGYHWERVKYTSIYDSEENRVKVVGTCIDITEQKKNIARYDKHMNTLLKLNPNAIGSFRLNLTKNWCGAGHSLFESIIAYQKEATVDGFFTAMRADIVNDEDAAGFAAVFDRVRLLALFGGGTYSEGFEYRTSYGEFRCQWVGAYISMFRNPASNDIEAIIYITNTNDKRVADAVINDAIAHDYDSLIYYDCSTYEYIPYMDRDDAPRYRHMQENLFDMLDEELCRYIITEEREQAARELSPDAVVEALEHAVDYNVYISVQKSGGAISRKKLRFSYVDKADNKVMLTISDVTDVYIMEQRRRLELEAALRTAKKANAAKSDFLSRMSHDIRTPMNGIIGMNELAMKERDVDVIQTYMAKINTSAQFLLGLINDILDMSRIESGSFILRPELYKKEDFVNYIDAVISPLCREKSISFIYEVEPCDFDIIIDKLRFNQILSNLLTNSVKFTPAGGSVSLRVGNYKVFENNTAELECVVADTGCGMSSSFTKHMFDTFAQENKQTGDTTGTGLGLSIVKQIVEMMNGRIEYESEPGNGTTFRIYVSCGIAYSQNAGKIAEEDISEDMLKGSRILICEDNELNAEIAQLLLEGHGALTDIAANGQIAVDLMKSAPEGYYQAILMDIRMPVMDGLEATRRIRRLDREDASRIPIIAMTANAFTEDADECIKAGMDEHLRKPIETKKVLNVIKSHIMNATT